MRRLSASAAHTLCAVARCPLANGSHTRGFRYEPGPPEASGVFKTGAPPPPPKKQGQKIVAADAPPPPRNAVERPPARGYTPSGIPPQVKPQAMGATFFCAACRLEFSSATYNHHATHDRQVRWELLLARAKADGSACDPPPGQPPLLPFSLWCASCQQLVHVNKLDIEPTWQDHLLSTKHLNKGRGAWQHGAKVPSVRKLKLG